MYNPTNPTNPNTKPLQAALFYYKKLGFNVIPIIGKNKPLVSWKKYQTTKITETEIKEWFKPNDKEKNLALITGKISQIVVIDIDNKKALEFLKQIEGFKEKDLNTWKVYTRRGFHLYYKYDPNEIQIRNIPLLTIIKNNKIKSICDLKGDGGMVTLPPSKYAFQEKTYQYYWDLNNNPIKTKCLNLPTWLKKFILKKQVEAENKQNDISIKDLYKGVEEGMRNVALAKLAGSWFRDGLTIEEGLSMAKCWNQNNPKPLPDREVIQTVKSIFAKEREKKEKINKWHENFKKAIYNKDKNTIIKLLNSPLTNFIPISHIQKAIISLIDKKI